MKRLSFITQFKIELLLPFSGCRKVPGKMPDNELVCFTPLMCFTLVYIALVV